MRRQRNQKPREKEVDTGLTDWRRSPNSAGIAQRPVWNDGRPLQAFGGFNETSNYSIAMPMLALLVSNCGFAASAAAPRTSEDLNKILDAPLPDTKEHSKAP